MASWCCAVLCCAGPHGHHGCMVLCSATSPAHAGPKPSSQLESDANGTQGQKPTVSLASQMTHRLVLLVLSCPLLDQRQHGGFHGCIRPLRRLLLLGISPPALPALAVEREASSAASPHLTQQRGCSRWRSWVGRFGGILVALLSWVVGRARQRCRVQSTTKPHPTTSQPPSHPPIHLRLPPKPGHRQRRVCGPAAWPGQPRSAPGQRHPPCRPLQQRASGCPSLQEGKAGGQGGAT